MSSGYTRYYPGGFIVNAPAQNKAEQIDAVAATYTAWDTDGTVTIQRPLNAAELAQLAAQDAENNANANDAATQTALATAMARLTQIGNQGTTLAAQSTAWTVAQQKAVAQALADMAVIQRQLIRRAIGLFDGSN